MFGSSCRTQLKQPPGIPVWFTEMFARTNVMTANTSCYTYKYLESGSLYRYRSNVDYTITEWNDDMLNAENCIFDGIPNNNELALKYIATAIKRAEEIPELQRGRYLYIVLYGKLLECEYNILVGQFDEARELLEESILTFEENSEIIRYKEVIKNCIEHAEIVLLLTEFLMPYYQ